MTFAGLMTRKYRNVNLVVALALGRGQRSSRGKISGLISCHRINGCRASKQNIEVTLAQLSNGIELWQYHNLETNFSVPVAVMIFSKVFMSNGLYSLSPVAL